MKSEFLDFASILTEIGQTSPLNLMAIFLKRLNLVLGRSLNGIISFLDLPDEIIRLLREAL